MQVSEVTKAFRATFIDIEGLKFVVSLAYHKGGHLYVYLKDDKFDAEEVQKEIDEVFRSTLRLSNGDVSLMDRRAGEYRFAVLNEKIVKKAFARLHRAFKRKRKEA